MERLNQSLEETANSVISIAADITEAYDLINLKKLHRLLLSFRNHERYYSLLMDKANSYEQWAAAGYIDEWKNEERSSDYDHELIRERLNNLRTIRREGDTASMIFNLRTSLSRNLGAMGNPSLYLNTNVGTKALIEDYIDEVTKQLTFICDVEIPGFTVHDKLLFFRNTQLAFGRTALLLSGGGTFGLSHIGTIKALWEQRLLPKVITGSSAGSIVAGIFCTKSDKEIQQLVDPIHLNMNFFEREEEPATTSILLSRFLKHGVIRDVEIFNECMYDNIGDITFVEAYNKTRRVLNITVSSSTNFEMPRLLNYLTAPNVLIRSAIAASSSVPFVYKSAPLMAKDADKNIVPWNPSGHKWVDGSIERYIRTNGSDLPMQRISEMFGVNHYLVAQTNPHIVPFLNPTIRKPTRISHYIRRLASIVGSEFHHRFSQFIDLGIHSDFLFKCHSVMAQKYEGDVTIVPYFTWSMFGNVMANPHLDMARGYTNAGERATWPKIAVIRNHCLIEQCISQNITSLRERLVESYDSTKIESHQMLLSVGSTALLLNTDSPLVTRHRTSFSLGSRVPLVSFSSIGNILSEDSDKEESVFHLNGRSSLNRSHKSDGNMRSILYGLAKPSAIPSVMTQRSLPTPLSIHRRFSLDPGSSSDSDLDSD